MSERSKAASNGFQILHQELETSAGVIRSLLQGIDQAGAALKPDPQSWSILEVVCHLHAEEIEDFREHLDLVLHRRHEGRRRTDPGAWVSEREYNKQKFSEIREKFFEERRKSLAWLQKLKDSDWDLRYPTPWGEISGGDVLASWVAHDNLHIRQLVELRRFRMEQITQPHGLKYAGDWKVDC